MTEDWAKYQGAEQTHVDHPPMIAKVHLVNGGKFLCTAELHYSEAGMLIENHQQQVQMVSKWELDYRGYKRLAQAEPLVIEVQHPKTKANWVTTIKGEQV